MPAENASAAPGGERFNPHEIYGPLNCKIFSSPHKYVQKCGLLKDIGAFIKPLGDKKPAIIIPDFLIPKYGKIIDDSVKKYCGVSVRFLNFSGENSWEEVRKLLQEAKDHNLDLIIGFGGGKAIDCAKATAYESKVPCVIIPSLASNDAPCSALSVMYTPSGEVSDINYFPDNPYCVLVDPEIIAGAPKRFLISGMGDAMSTFYEADACNRAPHARNCVGGRPTASAVALGSLCRDLLFQYGAQAVRDVDSGAGVTDAIEKVVEANTLLSGLGFESGGLACAHAFHNGLTQHPGTHHTIHGEKVAFSTLVQLMMEGNEEEARRVGQFLVDVGLPVHLGQLGIQSDDMAGLKIVCDRACIPEESMHHMPMTVTSEVVLSATLAADKLGRQLSGLA